MKQPFLEIGQIVAPHGIAGELRVQYWCDSVDTLASLNTVYFDASGRKAVALLSARLQKNVAVLQLEGIGTRDEAEALRGQVLYAKREDIPLPKGSHFIADLVGLTVVDADSGCCYGKIAEVLQPGANDVYVLKDKTGAERLFPAAEEFVISLDWESETMTVRPPEGLFDED